MGKHLRKCRRIRKLAVMQATQPVGARTRAARRLALAAAGGRRSSRRKNAAAAATGEYQISYLELRSRSVALKRRIARSAANSSRRPMSSPELGRISRCSSNASCQVPRPPSRSPGELDTATFFRSIGERGEMTASSDCGDEASDLEWTVETESCGRSTLVTTPSDAELEEFFAEAEKDLRRRFAERYNFDIVKDLPLAGRYEWIPLTPGKISEEKKGKKRRREEVVRETRG